MMPRSRTARVALAIAAGVTVLSACVLVSSARVADTYPWGDTATTSIFAMRAAHGDLATGAYSRFHWNHPGPLLYQLLAPLYRLSGYHEISLKWTVLALNLGALAALLFIVATRAPALALLIAAAFSPLLYREQRLLFWAWNPIVPLVPLALAMASAAAIAIGEIALLPLFVGVASFIAQAHVGFVPLLAAVGLTTASWYLTGSGANGSAGLRRALVQTLVVAALLWAVPLSAELRTRPGNLLTLARFFIDGSGESHPWREVLAVYANQLVGPYDPGWELTTSAASTNYSWVRIAATGLQLLALVGVIARARSPEDRFERAFATICLVTSLAGLAATYAIAGPISDYLVVWLAILGALNLAVIGAFVVGRTRFSRNWRLRPRSTLARVLLIAYLLIVGVLGAVRLVGKQAADARSVVVRDFAADLQRYCEAQRIDRPVLGFSWPAWQIATGIVLQYYKAGRPIALSPEYVYLAGDAFKTTGRETGEFYLMPQDQVDLPAGVTGHEWLRTLGTFRLVRVFRELH